ncbi:MAG: ATP-binding protein [Acidobacteria bacterium]|nr:ATP-binding protein [Acidobacteriota bacterium]
MKRRSGRTIFARREPADFVGRAAEMESLIAHAHGDSIGDGLAVLAEPGAGTSELLRQVFDRLFASQSNVIPFYFELKRSDTTPFETACRMARGFLIQAVAFRRQDPSIIAGSPDLDELARLASPADIDWVDRIIETIRSLSDTAKCSAGVRTLLGVIGRSRVPVCAMIDEIEKAADIPNFLEDLNASLNCPGLRTVFAGDRRFLFAKTSAVPIALARPIGSHLAAIVANVAAAHSVGINDTSRDLISWQSGGDLRLAKSLIEAAAAVGSGLESFEDVERVYTDELFGGRISRHFDLQFEEAADTAAGQIAGICAGALASGGAEINISYWKRHTDLGEKLPAVLQRLNYAELIDLAPSSTKIAEKNIAFSDYLRARTDLARRDRTRAQAVGEALAANLERAPQIMGAAYRRHAALGISHLLAGFNGQKVPELFLDYGMFRAVKGAPPEEVLKASAVDNSFIELPNISYTAAATDFYPNLASQIEAERTGVGIGTIGSRHERVNWIAAEIDSKLEADRELAEFWCDRLEMAAVACDLTPFRLWLIAPEGFSPEALEILKERNAYGTSKRQFEMLKLELGSAEQPREPKVSFDYEFVIPMGPDTELIGARAIEDIAKRHQVPAKAINQIKTALVEACINASEHSLSPDSKIMLKAAVDPGRIVITVSNRGLRLADRNPVPPSNESRRGWGLKLIKGLMDDVDVKDTDDGTVISMTKLF